MILQFRHEPVALILTRQALPTLDRTRYAAAAGLAKGAYVLADAPDGKPEVLLLATGSEVQLCVAAHEQLLKEGVRSRVVSMPSWELFERPAAGVPGRRAAALGRRPGCRVEQASTLGWERYVGLDRATSSACARSAPRRPLKELQKKFGFDPGAVVAAAKEQLDRARGRQWR